MNSLKIITVCIAILVSACQKSGYRIGDVWMEGPMTVEVGPEKWETEDGESGQKMYCFVLRYIPSPEWTYTGFSVIDGFDYTPGCQYIISIYVKNEVIDVLPNGDPILIKSAILDRIITP